MVAIWTLLLFELVVLGGHKLWTAFREGGRHLVKCLYKGCEPGGRGRARFKACLTNELKLSGKGNCSQAERRAVPQRVALPGRLRWRPMRHRILSRREKIHPRVSCRRSNEKKNKLENLPPSPSGTTPSRTGCRFVLWEGTSKQDPGGYFGCGSLRFHVHGRFISISRQLVIPNLLS